MNNTHRNPTTTHLTYFIGPLIVLDLTVILIRQLVLCLPPDEKKVLELYRTDNRYSVIGT